ncbi:phosphate ABC transporter substrate-binding protein PstS family protein [Nitrosomonas sp. JL21]|uniref:PstS family phosphate ABC transporter substrate-binding protein n=1 Tax=Nitrosomonas sp. JL21 TaxID=153949 RepID=UPI0013705715|nr:PstS family phosphate ABC transporter substrate-binding protein [Nitrosomonas sp. JL21]MBL8496770.1 PstS family phosphate ABC transporter substrate-binding protein [Nitrosomonas sp.]MBL8498478.1 PstS family phosphate ABC transporter substrate-binding protein [Nitrosomonas sp.]MXS78406.1 phosphate ABC transporter substrate-binding protein PstS family protein [Nitrosomonas sp. JL21]
MFRQRLTQLSALIALWLFISGSGNADAQPVILIDGSSTVYPITKAVADKFEAAKKNTIKTSVNISGSSGGFRKFCRGEIDIVNASRPILKHEIKECKNARVQYVEIPVAFDAVTVAINPANSWTKAMTVAELKKIWEPAAQGRITRWSQINPTWPDESIKLYGADIDSGTYDYFTEAIIGKARSSRTDFTQSENHTTLIDAVAAEKNALGFFNFAYYIENQDKVAAVAINNGTGAVLPSVETVENGSYQPLSRPIFIYVNIQAAEKTEVKEFVEFYMKNALLIVKEVKFFSLPPRAYATMLEHFNKKRVGTVFDGISAVGLTIDDLIRREGRLEFEHH